MAGIRITNRSGDDVTVTLCGETVSLSADASYTFDRLTEKEYSLSVHRSRIPLETVSRDETDKDVFEKSAGAEKSVHVPLDSAFLITLISSKAALCLDPDISGKEGPFLDALFSGYRLSGTGAETKKTGDCFASKRIKRKFFLHQLKNVFMPVGLIAVFLLICGIAAAASVARGKPVELGGAEATPLRAGLVLSAGVAGTVYVAAALINALRYLKKYRV